MNDDDGVNLNLGSDYLVFIILFVLMILLIWI